MRENPSQEPKVLPCHCTQGGEIKVKSGVGDQNAKPRFSQKLFATAAALWQDARFGKGMRLHNHRRAKGKDAGYTCTVCGDRKAL